jgi:hypothetical protein
MTVLFGQDRPNPRSVVGEGGLLLPSPNRRGAGGEVNQAVLAVIVSAILPTLWRWLSGLLILNLTLFTGLDLAGCNPTSLKTEAAQVSQLVISTLGDPKTFNYA